MRAKINIALISLILLSFFSGCSRKKNGFTRRAYHNTTARYNGYFNAREIKKANVLRIYNEHKDDFSEIIPLFIYPDEAQSKAMYPDMDKIIEKTSEVIDRHSMYIKKKEHNRWIDDCYMLMGQARFYKQEYFVGEEVFEYVAKAFKNTDAKYEALIWLARTHIQMQNMNKAESFLDRVDRDGVPNRLSSDFNALYADFYIKKRNYDEAIARLTKALETTKKREAKRRFNYVLAQLWLKKKEFGRASELFTEVIKLKPKYDMMFNAKISRALSFDPNSGEKNDIKKMLSKMVRDKKNTEYLDQIYYALADIAFKEENEPLGIEYLQKSASSSVSNNKQKAISYLRLGELFFEKPDYIKSQAYYDSCMTVLPEDYSRYESIYTRSKSLSKLVDNILIVEKEDSLQKLANDETYRNQVIEDLIQKAKEEEERKKREAEDSEFNPLESNGRGSSDSRNSGKWYFYNPTTLGFGFTNFKKNWGSRKLEDHWRRSNKETVATFEEDDLTENTDTAEIDTSLAENKITNPEYYLKHIPLTEKQLSASHNKIIEALFLVGNIYREDFEDYDHSTKAFEELIERYDTCRYKLPSWYNLYRIGLSSDNDPLTEKYKSLIVSNYPESEYARIINDPTHNVVIRENRKRVDNYYSIVYGLYTKRNYDKVLFRCKKAKSIFADNHLLDHFDFLAAMSIGHTNTLDSFKIALENVITKHPDSEVTVEAKRILELIKSGVKIEAKEIEKTVPYNHVFDTPYNFIAVIPSSDNKTNKYKVDISNFNSTYYSSKTYDVSNIFVDASNQLILVKNLKSYDEAVDYFKSFKLNGDQLKDLNEKSYQYFIITEENFILFYQNRDIKGYSDFFAKNFELEL